MDILAHGLYGGALVLKKSPQLYWLSVLSGMAPDIVAGSFRLYKAGSKKALPSFLGIHHDLPDSAYTAYHITHSFITAFCLFLVLFFIHRDLAILALPYAFHILCDIPFHTGRFATRFLYPLSSFHINGYEYARHKWLYVPNYLLIAIVYIFLVRQ